MLMLHNLPPLTSSSESGTRQPMRGENCPHWTNERPETPGECVSIPWSHKAATQINRAGCQMGGRHFRRIKILCFLCHPESHLSPAALQIAAFGSGNRISISSTPLASEKRLAIIQRRLEPSQ